MAVYVAPISSGLGDLIVSLPVVQALIESGEQTHLVCRSARQQGFSERIRGLASEISEEEFNGMKLSDGDRYVNLRDHPLQKNYIWGTPEFEAEFGPLKITQIIEIIARDMKIDVDFQHLTPLSFSPHTEFGGTVAFLPGTDGYQKHWPVRYWLELNRLLEPHSKVVMLGIPDQSPPVADLLEHGLNLIPTPDITMALDIISSCACVVAVDTGLMHLAVHQGRPTVALFNRSGLYRRLEPNCRAILSAECSELCKQEFPISPNLHKTSFTFAEKIIDDRNCRVSEKESCMGNISPLSVFNAVRSFGLPAATAPAHAAR